MSRPTFKVHCADATSVLFLVMDYYTEVLLRTGFEYFFYIHQSLLHCIIIYHYIVVCCIKCITGL